MAATAVIQVNGQTVATSAAAGRIARPKGDTTFSGEASTPDAGANEITTYNWSFDGASSSNATPTFTLVEGRVHTITLQVADDLANEATATLTVVVPGGFRSRDYRGRGGR